MKQYETYWAELPAPIGRRPVLLLTRTPAYEYLNKVMVAEITTTIRGIPQEVPLGRPEGMRQRCVANLDDVHVIAKSSLRERAGVLAAARHRQVKRALGFALDWGELKVLSAQETVVLERDHVAEAQLVARAVWTVADPEVLIVGPLLAELTTTAHDACKGSRPQPVVLVSCHALNCAASLRGPWAVGATAWW